MTRMPGVRIAGLLLAAGRGRRFDASGRQDKLLQRLPGASSHDAAPNPPLRVAEQACRRLREGTQAVLAVIRPDAPAALREALLSGGAELSVCPDADQGMGHSLAHAVRAARERWPDLQGVLVMPADMPWVQADSVRAVAEALMSGRTNAQCGIVIAITAQGERGHPVGFDERHFDALQALQGDAGARKMLTLLNPVTLVLDDPGIVRDVDTPEDLETP